MPKDGEMYPDPRTPGGNTQLILGDEKVLLDKTVKSTPKTGESNETTGF